MELNKGRLSQLKANPRCVRHIKEKLQQLENAQQSPPDPATGLSLFLSFRGRVPHTWLSAIRVSSTDFHDNPHHKRERMCSHLQKYKAKMNRNFHKHHASQHQVLPPGKLVRTRVPQLKNSSTSKTNQPQDRSPHLSVSRWDWMECL